MCRSAEISTEISADTHAEMRAATRTERLAWVAARCRCMPCVVTRSADSASSGQAAASRLRAKQLENISRYMSACIDLGVDRKNHRDIAEDVADA